MEAVDKDFNVLAKKMKLTVLDQYQWSNAKKLRALGNQRTIVS
jgi:hypothetical protein